MSFRRGGTRWVRCAAALAILWTSMCAAALATSTPALPSGQMPTGKLVFSSNRDGNSQIHKVNADGSGLTNLTNDDNQPASNPKWSPDGTKILFTRTITKIRPDSIASGEPVIDSSTKLFVMTADGSEQKRLTDDSSGTASAVESLASWSPDGSTVLFVRSSAPDRTVGFSPFRLYIINSDGSGENAIGPNTLESLGIDLVRGIFNGPQWSSDGQTILFELGTRLWIMNADGSAFADGETIRELTAHPANGASARFSPDGSEIAFASNRDGDFDIFVMARDGSNQQPLTNNQIADFDPNWSPDGSVILFERDSTYDMDDLWLLDRATAKERMIVEQVDGLAEAIFMGDGWIAVERRAGEDEQDIKVYAIDGSTSYILADTAGYDALGSWHPDAISGDATGDATAKSNEAGSTRSLAWPMAAIGMLGVAGVCAGVWHWTSRKPSGPPPPST